MKFLRLIAIALLCLAAPASAFWQSRDSNYNTNIAAGGGGGCAQATTWLGRVTVDATHQAAYTTLICGAVTDGWWSKLDGLYILNTQTSTAALLNLISTSFPLTNNGALTFTADHGYAQSNNTSYLSTTFAASGGTNYTQNSASFGGWTKDTALIGAGYVSPIWGDGDQQENRILLANNAGGSGYYTAINQPNYAPCSGANSVYVGLWILNRTGSTASQLYNNGSTIGSACATASQARNAITWRTSDSGGNSSEAMAMLFMGSALTGTDITNIGSRYGAWNTTISGGNP